MALAACDGTLQFSSPGGSTGGGAGSAPDASPGEDASWDMGSSDLGVPPDTTAPGDTAPPSDSAAPSDTANPSDTATDRGAGFAPPCRKDTDCPVNKLHCDLVTGQCVECVGNADCVVDPYFRCDTGVHRCVQCLSPNDCASGALCDPATRLCIAQCQDAAGCPAAQPYCDALGRCVECRTNADCFRLDLCDTTIGRCAFCASDQNCAAPNLRCDPYNPGRARCKECLIPADCPMTAPYCDVHGGICIAGP